MNPFIISLAIRLTILLLAGGLATVLVRRSTYAMRHVVIAATLICVIALPATMLAIPEWRVAVLPAATREVARSFTLTVAPTRAATGAAATPTVDATRAAPRSNEGAHPALVTTMDEVSTSAMAASMTSSESVALPSLLSRLASATAAQLLLTIWLLGVAVGLLWIAVGRYGLARIRRRAMPLATYEWRTILENEALHAGVSRRVALLSSAQVSGPVTWGVLSPVIVLPETSLEWTHERKRVVVMHEMAHIARRDSATQLVATFACVAYWLHPLVLLAARRLRAECERACDERVLARGTPAAEYAAHLLDVARFSRSFGAASIVSVAMARPSQLEGRLLAVLRAKPRKSQLSHRTRVLGAVAALVMLMAISAFRPVERTAEKTLANSAAAATNVVKTLNSAVDTGEWVPAMPVAPVAPAAPRVPKSSAIPQSAPSAPLAPSAWSSQSAFNAPAAPDAPISPATPFAALAPSSPSTPFAPLPPMSSLGSLPDVAGSYHVEAYDSGERAPAAAYAYVYRTHGKPDSTFEKSVPAQDGGTLVLDLDTGGEIHITGTDDSKVQVNTTLAGTTWRRTTVDLDKRDAEVRLESRYEPTTGMLQFDNTFTIMVPKHFDIRMTSAGGSVTISNVEGKFSGTTAGGSISIDHSKGVAMLSTGGGDIKLVESHLDGSIATGGGVIMFTNVTGNIKPVTASGGGYSYGQYGRAYSPGKSYSAGKKSYSSGKSWSMPPGSWVTPDVSAFKSEDFRSFVMPDIDTMSIRIARKSIEQAANAMKHMRIDLDRERATMEHMRLRNDSGSDTAGFDSTWAHERDAMDAERDAMDEQRDAMERQRDVMDALNLSEALGRPPKLIVIDKAGGSIKLLNAPQGAHLHTGGGAIIVDHASGAVLANTGAGSITLSRVDGEARATTGAGDITVVTAGDGAEPIDVSSGAGNVELSIPKGANATLDLETAYTKSFGRKTIIKGDVPLDVTESEEWDSSRGGTPRKYVRVRQRIGKGGPLIRVRTVNGDIRIKEGS